MSTNMLSLPKEWTMDNGIRVLLDPMSGIRSVSIGVFLHTGSAMESPQEWGLSHFMEHMVFKGTAHRSARDIAMETDAAGGHFNAFTARDCTCFYASVIDEDLGKALDILSDLTLHATLAQEDMEKERGVILEEIAMEEDDPEGTIEELVHQKMYADLPVAHEIVGYPEQVSRYTREDLVRFRDSHYAPSRCVISVSGSFEEAVLLSLLEKAFGKWASPLSDIRQAPVQPVCFSPVYRDRDLEQMHLCLTYPALSYGSQELTTLSLLSSILGGQSSSRLFMRVREDLGLAYSLYSYSYALEATGTFSIYAAASPANIARVHAEIHKELSSFLKNGCTEQEMQDGKNFLRISNLMSLEHSSSRMMSQGQTKLFTGKPFDLGKSIEKLQKITRDQLMDLAQSLFSHTPVLGLLGPGAEAIGGQL